MTAAAGSVAPDLSRVLTTDLPPSGTFPADGSRLASSPPRSALRVLLVEDDPLEGELIKGVLAASTEGPFELRSVADFEAGLALLCSREFDVVLARVPSMGMPPAQALSRLKQVRDTTVVLLGEGADNALREAALQGGADDLLIGTELATRLLGRCLRSAVERHQARGNQRRLERWMSISQNAVLVTSPEGRVLKANPAALALFGRTEPELLAETLELSLADTSASTIELTRGGERRAAQMQVVPVEWCGKSAFLASFRDETARVEAAAQALLDERLSALGRLAASTAHELNSPMAAVIVNLDLAAKEAALPGLTDLRQLIADAREAAERVRTSIGDLRVFAGWRDDPNGVVDVRRPLEAALRISSADLRNRARMTVHLDRVPCVRASEAGLAHVLVNLIRNAAQSIPEGNSQRHRITISTGRRDEWVLIEVTDDGCGMSEEAQARLFAPTPDGPAERRGPGLGLLTCRRLVDAFGGELELHSRPGAGTSARILLHPMSDTRVLRRRAQGEPVRAVRRSRLLVVDDDVISGDSMARALGGDHELKFAESAEAALRILRNDTGYDLVFCDRTRPSVAGGDLYQSLLSLHPELAKRVVFLTAARNSARSFGSANPPELAKPFDVFELRSLVADLLVRGQP